MNQISSKQFRILAVAPSTRGFGFVVMEGEKTIIECATRTADVKKKDKNAQSITKLKKLLDFYQPGVLVLQDAEAKGSRRAPRIRQLIKQIVSLAQRRKIKVKLISRRNVAKFFFGNGKGTKHDVAKILAERFPEELGNRLPPLRRAWMTEDSRMDIFDAVAFGSAFRPSQS
jgi:Holliday junction resolvasome RuvABC endonuclease subunit